jgi:membrane protease YdiL (CAAX protease family)
MRAPIRAGLSGAFLWLSVEFLARDVLGGSVFLARRAWQGADPPAGDVQVLDAVLLLAAAVALLALFDGRRRRAGLELNALAYHFSWTACAAGVACGGLLLGAIAVTEHIDSRLFGLQPGEAILRGLREARYWAIVPMLVGNGTVVPIAEEFAWRGYIQTQMARAWGPWPALAVTALLFTVKHIVVDLSIARITTLLTVSIALGLVRHRYGTLASTVAHYTMNSVASGVATVLALSP